MLLSRAQVIRWKGFQSTVADLLQSGWTIVDKPAFERLSKPYHSNRARHKIYFKTPEKMLGRITLHKEDTKDKETYFREKPLEFDFILQERKAYKRTTYNEYVPIFVGEEDVERLMEMILEIQAKRPKKARVRENKIVQLKSRSVA